MLERLAIFWQSRTPAYHGGSWIRRLRLWRAGDRSALLDSAEAIVWLAVAQYMLGTYDESFAGWMANCFTVLVVLGGSMFLVPVILSARERQPRFAQEWLRPVSRYQAVDDYLRGVAIDLAVIPLLGIVASLWPVIAQRATPDFNLLWKLLAIVPATYLFCVGTTLLLTLRSKKRDSLLPMGIDVLCLSPLTLLFLLPQNPLAAAMIALAVSLPLLAYGTLFIAIARRTWLERELE